MTELAHPNGQTLTPANENPWYIMMTLYGEHEGARVDHDLAEKNRNLWNAWICQGIDPSERAEIAKKLKIDISETEWSDEKQTELRKRFKARVGPNRLGLTIPDFNDLIDLRKIAFFNKVVLKNAIFRTTSFHNAHFVETTYFANAHFGEMTIFSRAKFDGFSYFIDTRFGGPDPEKNIAPSFTNAVFNGPTSLQSAHFTSHMPDLTGATLHDTTTLTADLEKWPPLCTGWAQDTIPHEQDAKDAKDSAAALRHVMAKQARPEEEHFFFRREMYHTARIGSWYQRLPYRVFGLVSDFGHAIDRPAWCLVYLILAPLGVYLSAFGPFGWAAIGNAFALSFSSVFKIFGLQSLYFAQTLSTWDGWFVPTLSALQTILGFILLFFLGLGLRTRFRLR